MKLGPANRSPGESKTSQFAFDQIEVPDLDHRVDSGSAAGQALATRVENDVCEHPALAGKPQGDLRVGGIGNRPDEDLSLWRVNGKMPSVG